MALRLIIYTLALQFNWHLALADTFHQDVHQDEGLPSNSPVPTAVYQDEIVPVRLDHAQAPLGILDADLSSSSAVTFTTSSPLTSSTPSSTPSTPSTTSTPPSIPPRKSVAIIGSGSAGSSTAYFLRRLSDIFGFDVDITVFERNGYIGGRSTTVFAFQKYNESSSSARAGSVTENGSPAAQNTHIPLELGASIFVSVNEILMDAVEEFDLNTGDDSDASEEVLGVWDGQKMVVRQVMGGTKLQQWWTNIKILWKYGFAPIRALSLMRSTVDKFLRMYEEPVFPWRQGLTQASADVGLLDATASTGSQFIHQNSISGLFANQIIQASTRVNYAQNLGAIHGLEAMVCLATDGAMSVQGGNWKIFAGMLNASRADVHLGTAITNINREDGVQGEGKFTLTTSSNESFRGFDTLVLAAPYHQTGIDFSPKPSHIPDDIDYVQLHVTLFSSPYELSSVVFGTPSDAAPDVILTTLQEDEEHTPTPGEHVHQSVGRAGFFSISKLRSVTNYAFEPPRQENVYKIFSADKIDAAFLTHILGLSNDTISSPSSMLDISQAPINAEKGDEKLDVTDVSWIYRKLWKSYPYLPPRITFEPQILDHDLWYTSGIESFISTMETSALSGKNIATLIVDGWLGR